MKVVSVMLLPFVLLACNYEAVKTEVPDDEPRGGDPAFEAIRVDVDRECGRCHNGTVHPLAFRSGDVFKNSKARARIEGGTMPPDKTLGPDVKERLLAYLK